MSKPKSPKTKHSCNASSCAGGPCFLRSRRAVREPGTVNSTGSFAKCQPEPRLKLWRTCFVAGLFEKKIQFTGLSILSKSPRPAQRTGERACSPGEFPKFPEKKNKSRAHGEFREKNLDISSCFFVLFVLLPICRIHFAKCFGGAGLSFLLFLSHPKNGNRASQTDSKPTGQIAVPLS